MARKLVFNHLRSLYLSTSPRALTKTIAATSNDNFANNEQPRYDDQPNNYAMEPREGQYGKDAMSGNVHQTSSYPQASYEPQPSYDQQPNYDHTNGNANGGSVGNFGSVVVNGYKSSE